MMFLGWGGLRLRPSGLADTGAGTCSVGWEAQKGLKLGRSSNWLRVVGSREQGQIQADDARVLGGRW